MKALISPQENNRIAEVAVQEFEVADPLFWTTCPDNCTTAWTYDNGVFTAPVIPVPTVDENKATAVNLLQATDWATRGSVSDPALSNPYLTNQDAFFSYQNTVRQVAINPVAGNLTWPTQPTPQWSN